MVGHFSKGIVHKVEVTLNNMPDNGVVFVVTYAGTTQREPEERTKNKNLRKNIKIKALGPPLAHRCTIFLCYLGCEI